MNALANATETGALMAHRQSLSAPVRLLLWAAGFILAFALCLQWGTDANVHTDFTQNVWLPSRILSDGHNPYFPTRQQVDAALGSYSVQFTNTDPNKNFNSGVDFHFIYPVWIGAALAPFAAIPLWTSMALWRALNILLLVWAVGAIMRASNPTFRALKPQALAAIGVTTLLCILPTFRESFITLYHGQFSIIELGLLAAVWGWLISSAKLETRQRLWGDTLTGVALAVLATKPQAVGLPVILLGLWALSRRRFFIPGVAAIALAALLLIPNLFYPWALGDWLKVVIGGQAGSQAQVSASVWGVSYHLLGASSPWVMVALVLSVLGIAALLPRWWRDLKDRTSPTPLALPITLCVNSVISPYMLGYEHVVLLLPALVLLASAGLPSEYGVRSAECGINHSALHTPHSALRWRLAVYAWLAILPMLVLTLQVALDGKEYPAIAQSLTMLALCGAAKLRVGSG